MYLHEKRMQLSGFVYRIRYAEAANLIQRLRSKRSNRPDAGLSIVLEILRIIAIGLDTRRTQ
jgi:hypothetical protein